VRSQALKAVIQHVIHPYWGLFGLLNAVLDVYKECGSSKILTARFEEFLIRAREDKELQALLEKEGRGGL
jgi:hypothetical protein